MTNDQSDPSPQQRINPLVEAQQNGLNRLEGIVENQHALHRELAERRIEEVQLPGDDDVVVNEDRQQRRVNELSARQNQNIRNRSLTRVVIEIIFSLGLWALLMAYSMNGSFRGGIDFQKTSYHTSSSTLYPENAGSKTSSKEVGFDAMGNPLMKNTNADMWEAVVTRLHATKSDKKETSMQINLTKERQEITYSPSAAVKPKLPYSAPKSRPSTQYTTWSSIVQYLNHHYQLIVDRLEQEPYSVSLTSHNPQTDSNEENGFLILKNILFSWPGEQLSGNKTPIVTMLNTRERFKSIGYTKNFILSTSINYINSIMEYLDATWYGKETQNANFILDRLVASTPWLLIVANAFLILIYLLHGALADFFLGDVNTHVAASVRANTNNLREGEDTGGRRPRGGASSRIGRERLFGFLLFKVLLISAVVAPDTLDLLVLLIWYSILSLLRSLCHTSGSIVDHATQSGQQPCPGALLLLMLVLVCDVFAFIGCTSLFYDARSLLLLLTCDCVLLGGCATTHIIRYIIATCEEKHYTQVAELEEQIVNIQDRRTEIDSGDIAALRNLEEESRTVNQEVEAREAWHTKCMDTSHNMLFALDLFGSFVMVAHYIHVWILHGASFGLVGGILCLQIQSHLSAGGRKIAEWRNLNRIFREIDETFNDASDLDMRKASGDVCCVCLVPMTSGNVKKLGCEHLFHTNCLREVVERARSLRRASCPLCRTPLCGESLVDDSHSRQMNMANNNDETGQPVEGAAGEFRLVNNNQQANQNLNEQSLFRFSTERFLPAWLPVPAFAFEIVRRETPVLVEQHNGNVGGLHRFFRRGGTVDNNENDNGQIQGQQQQQSFWRRLFILAGVIPMTPEEEAIAVDQLTDMFPQYDRADLIRELRVRGSTEAVVESVFLGLFTGTPRGIAND